MIKATKPMESRSMNVKNEKNKPLNKEVKKRLNMIDKDNKYKISDGEFIFLN